MINKKRKKKKKKTSKKNNKMQWGPDLLKANSFAQSDFFKLKFCPMLKKQVKLQLYD